MGTDIDSRVDIPLRDYAAVHALAALIAANPKIPVKDKKDSITAIVDAAWSIADEFMERRQ